VRVSLIAAVAENRVIGRDGALPWHLPEDLRHFKRLTRGHVVVMGRRTWETLDGPLPRRRCIVVTRDASYRAEGAEVVHGLDEALERAAAAGETEVFVLGGGEIYTLALPRADRMYLTIVHAEPAGDARFPVFDAAEWTLASDEPHDADERHEHAYSFRTYERRGRPPS